MEKTVEIKLNADVAQAISALKRFKSSFGSTVSDTQRQAQTMSKSLISPSSILQKAFSSVTSVIGRAATGLWGTIKGVFGKIKGAWNSLTDVSQLASLFIGGAIANIAKEAINLAAEFERLPVAAEYLLGSAEKADEFSRAIRDLARDTVFGIDEIVTLGKQLIGTTEDVNVSEKALMALSDAVAATGGGYSELSSVTTAWRQVYQKATLSSEELNRQMSQHIPVLNKLAESIVNDADHPLRKYIQTATGAGGVTKQMRKDFEKAADVAQDASWKYDEFNSKIEKQKALHGENSWQVAKATDKMREFESAHRKATTTMSKYEQAQANANKTAVKAKLTVDEVKEALAQVGDLNIPGTLAAESITRALEEAYGGANLNLMKTFSAQMEKLQDTLKFVALGFLGLDESFRPIEGSLFGKFTQALTQINNLLEKNEERIVEFGKKLGQSLPAIVGLAAFLFGALSKAITMVLAPVIIAGATWAALGAIVAGTVGIFLRAAGGVEGVREELTSAGQYISEKFAPYMEQLRRAWYLVKPELEEVGQTMKEVLLPMFEKLGRIIKENIKGSIEDLISLFGSLLEGFSVDQFKQMFGGLKTALTGIPELSDRIKEAFKSAGEIIRQIFGPVIPELKQSFEDLKPALQLAWESLKSLSPLLIELGKGFLIFTGVVLALAGALLTGLLQALGPIIETITKMVASIITIVSGFFNLLYSIWTLNWEGIKNAAIQIWDGIQMWFQGFVSGAIDIAKSFFEGVYNWFKALYDALVGNSIVPEMVEAILGYFKSLKDKAVEFVQGLVSGVKDKFMGLANSALDWGKNLINNFVEGIKSAARSLGDVGRTVLDKVGLGDLVLQHGGIVPGPVGQAVPIIAHGGERITPRGSNTNAPFADSGNGGGGVTINMYGGVTLDSEQRVQELADRIMRIMGRQSELAKYGL